MKKVLSETEKTNKTVVLTEEEVCSEEESWPRNSASRRVYDILEDNIDDWSVREYIDLVRSVKDNGLTDDLILEEYYKIREKVKAYEQRIKNISRK